MQQFINGIVSSSVLSECMSIACSLSVPGTTDDMVTWRESGLPPQRFPDSWLGHLGLCPVRHNSTLSAFCSSCKNAERSVEVLQRVRVCRSQCKPHSCSEVLVVQSVPMCLVPRVSSAQSRGRGWILIQHVHYFKVDMALLAIAVAHMPRIENPMHSTASPKRIFAKFRGPQRQTKGCVGCSAHGKLCKNLASLGAFWRWLEDGMAPDHKPNSHDGQQTLKQDKISAIAKSRFFFRPTRVSDLCARR
eukprot:1524028-Amphidinium_carterae.2